jgi:prepilin-type N-terminal cleavage/methylation domain-containing protein
MKPALQNGFSLVEMAIVLMIVGLLLGGMLVPLSAQMDQRNVSDTQKTLSEIKEAIIGYAIVHGRLPCPASATTNGLESFSLSPVVGNASNGYCSNFYNGYVPAATLGVAAGVDNQGNTGFAIDSWGNRIHYAVTAVTATVAGFNGGQPFTVFTTSIGMRTTTLPVLAPNLLVCSAASTSSTSCSVANSSLTSSPGVPVVIYSTGKNGKIGGTSADEAENPNPNSADNDRVFVSHLPTPTFDDLVVWVSPNILYNRMVAAGTLP